MALSDALNVVNLRMMKQMTMSSAGPAAKADARKRAAMMAVSQYMRPGRPAIRNAVTVWMLMASGMAM